MSSARMTVQEVCAAYPNQWVVLGDLDFADERSLQVRSAVVIGWGDTRRQAVDRAMQAPAARTAISHTSRYRPGDRYL